MNILRSAIASSFSVLCLSACAETPQKKALMPAVLPYDCSSGKAMIPANVVDRRRLLGSQKVAARAIDNGAWFATRCAVPIKEGFSEPDCRPQGAELIPIDNTLMYVAEDTVGSFTMTLVTQGGKPVANVKMYATHGDPPDSARSYDFLEGYDDKARRFFVYIFDSLGAGVPAYQSPLEKQYRLQVYYSESFPLPPPLPPAMTWACFPHMPDYSAEDGKVGDKGIDIDKSPNQGGTGGGTEPGH